MKRFRGSFVFFTFLILLSFLSGAPSLSKPVSVQSGANALQEPLFIETTPQQGFTTYDIAYGLSDWFRFKEIQYVENFDRFLKQKYSPTQINTHVIDDTKPSIEKYFWPLLSGILFLALLLITLMFLSYCNRRKTEIADALKVQKTFLEARVERRTKELRLNEQRFRDFTDTASDWVWEMDANLKFTTISDLGLNRMGVKREHLIGKTRQEMVAHYKGTEVSEQAWSDHFATLNAHEPFRGFEYWITDTDGNRNHISVNGNPVFNDAGEFLGYRGTSRVITDLTNATERERKAREAADHANRTKSEFLASMSHEIRTPMTGILGMTDQLLEDDLPAHAQQKVRIIKSSGAALLKILNEILDVSRLEAGKLRLETQDFDPAELANDVTQVIRQTCSVEKQQKLNIQMKTIAGFPETIHADPSRLRQVLINLMGNAVKFTETGSVVLSCEQVAPKNLLKFYITDTGIGIEEEAQSQLFEEFVQADASISRKYDGTGLGLTICKRIVTLMGGEIGLSSAPGKGTTFWFTLPYSPAVSPRRVPSTETKSKDSACSATKAPREFSILVAEDNEINQDLIAVMLKRMGHVSTIVDNGSQALEAVERMSPRDFDLILMDIRMPVMSGLEATSKIRALPSPNAQIPIVALTADVLEVNETSFTNYGLTGFVTKPIDHIVLRKEIEKAVGLHSDTDVTVAPERFPEACPVMGQNCDTLNLDNVAERLAVPKESVVLFLNRFIDDYEDGASRIQFLISQNDLSEASRLAHSIYGVSASLGLKGVSSRSFEINEMIKEGRTQDIRIPVAALSKEISAAINDVQKLIKLHFL